MQFNTGESLLKLCGLLLNLKGLTFPDYLIHLHFKLKEVHKMWLGSDIACGLWNESSSTDVGYCYHVLPTVSGLTKS